MDFKQAKGNTWYLVGRQLMPVYRLDEHRCILMDPGRSGDLAGIEAALQTAGLTPAGVIVTHMHYDHHENTRYFRDKYRIPVAMEQHAAELCRDADCLRNHLYTFWPGLIATVPRLQNLICPVDRILLPEETKLEFQGAEFGIIQTPGHAPGHICIRTPDGVCFGGDCLMTEDDLAAAKVPFAFDMAQDLASKRKLLEVSCDTWLFSHQGMVTGPLDALVEANIQKIEGVLALYLELVDHPMTLSEIYAAVNTRLGLEGGHPIQLFYLERTLRPYLDYLMDLGKLVPANCGGAQGCAPAETPES